MAFYGGAESATVKQRWFHCRLWVRRFSRCTAWSMLVLAALPVVLRLALLAHNPMPVPQIADDFSNLLLGDTLAHFRLANPSHPMHRFFEAAFVLQEPSYSSIYPPGQGVLLALGELLFRQPWAGILLASGVLCALCYWALRAWTTSSRALAAGLLAVLEFGPLGEWTNQYWGGLASGIAGCLVFGSLPRLRKSGSTRYALLLGAGLALQLISRPFEFTLLLPVVACFLVPILKDLGKRKLAVTSLAITAAVFPAALLMLLQDSAVTGHWTTMPYMLSRSQYGMPTTFTFQPLPKPERQLTREQQADYDAQSDAHEDIPSSFKGFLQRWSERLPDYNYFFPLPLLLVLPFFLLSLRDWKNISVFATLLLFSLGTNFYPYFYANYIAVLIPLFLLVTVTGLAALNRLRIRNVVVGQVAVWLIALLCAGQFVWTYGLRISGNGTAPNAYASWGLQGEDFYQDRIAVHQRLAQASGSQLVFVHIGDEEDIQQWIQNGADIDHSRVVWALDLGAQENAHLLAYYPDRIAWRLQAGTAKLEPYK